MLITRKQNQAILTGIWVGLVIIAIVGLVINDLV